MVLGMVDTMVLGGLLLGSLAWAVVFAGLAVGLLVTPRGADMAGHRSVHLGVMALVTAVMAHPHEHGTPTAGTEHVHGTAQLLQQGAASHHAAALVTIAVAVAAGHAAYTVWAAARADGWTRVELVAGGVSALAMAGMLLA
jgi:hypothetical protein